MTGLAVMEAMTPGKAVATPAMPMKTWQPESSALEIISSRYFGALWADATLISKLTSNFSSTERHFSAIGKSDLEPSTTHMSMTLGE